MKVLFTFSKQWVGLLILAFMALQTSATKYVCIACSYCFCTLLQWCTDYMRYGE